MVFVWEDGVCDWGSSGWMVDYTGAEGAGDERGKGVQVCEYLVTESDGGDY